MKKNKWNWILWLVLVVIFAYDLFTVDSLGLKVLRGIMLLVCLTACYVEISSLKDKK